MSLINDLKYAYGRSIAHLKYRQEKNRKTVLTKEFISTSNAKKSIKTDYQNFKLTVFNTLMTFFEDVEKVVIRPKDSEVYLFEQLLGDEEFMRYFKALPLNEFNDIEFSLNEVG